MRIESQDKASFIELDRREDGGVLMLDAFASIGEFTARNRSIIVCEGPAFLREMAAFETSRRGTIALHGTAQDFELRFQAYDRLGHLSVGISIARRRSPRVEIEPLLFSGGFVYDVDYAEHLFAGLRELLRETP